MNKGSKSFHGVTPLAAVTAVASGLACVLAGMAGVSAAEPAGAGGLGARATVVGVLPDAHSGNVRVFVLAMPDLAGMRVTQRFTLPVLAAEDVGKGLAFRLTISARELRAAGQPAGAFINTQVVAVSKAGVSAVFAQVGWRPGAGAVVRVGRLRSFSRSTPGPSTALASPLHCVGTVVARKTAATRVGELHVASGGKVHGEFTYAGHADSVITVGVLKAGRWVTDGTAVISNQGLGGSLLVKKATSRYVETKFRFEELHFTGGCPAFTQMAVAWTGGGPTLGGKAPGIRFPSCHADPHGFLTLRHNVGYQPSGYKAVNYRTGAATGFGGYSFGASSGYSSAVHPGWLNTGQAKTYLCGSSGRHRQWPIIYNQNH